jgi:hypothetical protein
MYGTRAWSSFLQELGKTRASGYSWLRLTVVLWFFSVFTTTPVLMATVQGDSPLLRPVCLIVLEERLAGGKVGKSLFLKNTVFAPKTP